MFYELHKPTRWCKLRCQLSLCHHQKKNLPEFFISALSHLHDLIFLSYSVNSSFQQNSTRNHMSHVAYKITPSASVFTEIIIIIISQEAHQQMQLKWQMYVHTSLQRNLIIHADAPSASVRDSKKMVSSACASVRLEIRNARRNTTEERCSRCEIKGKDLNRANTHRQKKN